MRNWSYSWLLMALFVIALAGCKKDHSFEAKEPVIQNDTVKVYIDHVVFSWEVDFPGNIGSAVELGRDSLLGDAIRYGSERIGEEKSFEVRVDSLVEGAKYYYRYVVWNNYVTETFGVNRFLMADGGDDPEPPVDDSPEGAINGLFSTSENTQVYFSQGNLQYQASTNTWRFAENQWDYIGEGNGNISSTYNGWIDLFGWGTSGYNHGSNCYQPWSTSTSSSDYFAYGNYQYNLFDQTGKADWGYNAISNGGNTTNTWHTPTREEWSYVFNSRITISGIRYAKAKVNNVNGVILLPDNWSSSYYTLSNTNQGGASFSSNTITATQWNTLEQHGAVFLPAAGTRSGTSVFDVGSFGSYWSASYYGSGYAWSVYFSDSDLGADGNSYRYYGRSVRLVHSSQPYPTSMVPTVTTTTPTNVTSTSATMGGNVTSDGGATVTERGVCWSTSSNPTSDGNHQAASSGGTGTFTVSVIGLTPGTTYHVRAYAKNSQGTNYGEDYTFTTLTEGGDAPEGAINGLFSTSENTQVYFSQGNLQYQASTNTWRFAENQWDYIGEGNGNISSTYNGWIDLFGWGTSGYNHGSNCYQPWSTSISTNDYYAYGNDQYNLFDQTGKADWGYNAISNGGNTTNTWHTPTREEWSYVFNSRITISGIRYAKAKVNNVDGVILLPDNWSSSYYTLSNTNQGGASFSSNTITATQWNTLEQHGAVFLPAAGHRHGTSVGRVGSHGRYWSASYVDSVGAWGVYFYDLDLDTDGSYDYRCYGLSVRLVHSSQPYPSSMVPTVTTATPTNVTSTSATMGGNVTSDGGATVIERGVCWSTSSNPTTSGNHQAASTAGTGNFTVSVTGLTPGTTYHVRAYAKNSQGTSYGEDKTVTMGANAPTVTTATPSNVTQTTATMGGNVTSDGGATVTERGVCWSTSSNPTMSGNHQAASSGGTGTFTVNVTGLTPGTTYHVRAYATNSQGTSYGEDKTVTMGANAPTVTTATPTNVTSTSATMGGNVTSDGGATVTERGVCWSTSSNPTTSGNHQAASTVGTGNFTVSVTGLTPGTTYHVRAYAKNSQGTSYGEDKTVTMGANAPTVTTATPTNVTQTTATMGGNVTSDGGAMVTERGVCWSTSSNPTTSGNHQASSSGGTGTFTMSVTGLTPGTTYHVRAYAKNSQGTSYGEDNTFTTLTEGGDAPEGAINGLFSVSATQQVYFSQGNLQYQASTNTWRFADNQWDYVGEANDNISSTYSGWIDLFGWGTSGYNHGAVCYQPWSTSQNNSDYYAYGSYTYNLYDQTGQADWGYNAISNGGNQENCGWRTPTHEEWSYLFNTRSTSSGIRYAKAQVNDINGVILLPDNWSSSYYTLSNTNQDWASFSSNTITATQWNTLEQHGAVFLPAAGGRLGTSVDYVGSDGLYWSASYDDSNDAWYVYIYDSNLDIVSYSNRYYGRSVRLVCVFQ